MNNRTPVIIGLIILMVLCIAVIALLQPYHELRIMSYKLALTLATGMLASAIVMVLCEISNAKRDKQLISVHLAKLHYYVDECCVSTDDIKKIKESEDGSFAKSLVKLYGLYGKKPLRHIASLLDTIGEALTIYRDYLTSEETENLIKIRDGIDWIIEIVAVEAMVTEPRSYTLENNFLHHRRKEEIIDGVKCYLEDILLNHSELLSSVSKTDIHDIANYLQTSLSELEGMYIRKGYISPKRTSKVVQSSETLSMRTLCIILFVISALPLCYWLLFSHPAGLCFDAGLPIASGVFVSALLCLITETIKVGEQQRDTKTRLKVFHQTIEKYCFDNLTKERTSQMVMDSVNGSGMPHPAAQIPLICQKLYRENIKEIHNVVTDTLENDRDYLSHKELLLLLSMNDVMEEIVKELSYDLLDITHDNNATSLSEYLESKKEKARSDLLPWIRENLGDVIENQSGMITVHTNMEINSKSVWIMSYFRQFHKLLLKEGYVKDRKVERDEELMKAFEMHVNVEPVWSINTE